MTPYDKLIARKRTWTPVQTEAGKLKEDKETLPVFFFGKNKRYE